MDYDQFGGNDKLGLVTVPPKVLYDAKGERLEYELVATKDSMEASVSVVSMRVFGAVVLSFPRSDLCIVLAFREESLFVVDARLSTILIS